MKEFILAKGGQKIFSDDLRTIQQEALEAIAGQFEDLGAFVFQGCEVSYNPLKVTTGLCYIDGKVVRFMDPNDPDKLSFEFNDFPQYIVLAQQDVDERTLKQGGTAKTYTFYYAKLSANKPNQGEYIELDQGGAITYQQLILKTTENAGAVRYNKSDGSLGLDELFVYKGGVGIGTNEPQAKLDILVSGGNALNIKNNNLKTYEIITIENTYDGGESHNILDIMSNAPNGTGISISSAGKGLHIEAGKRAIYASSEASEYAMRLESTSGNGIEVKGPGSSGTGININEVGKGIDISSADDGLYITSTNGRAIHASSTNGDAIFAQTGGENKHAVVGKSIDGIGILASSVQDIALKAVSSKSHAIHAVAANIEEIDKHAIFAESTKGCGIVAASQDTYAVVGKSINGIGILASSVQDIALEAVSSTSQAIRAVTNGAQAQEAIYAESKTGCGIQAITNSTIGYSAIFAESKGNAAAIHAYAKSSIAIYIEKGSAAKPGGGMWENNSDRRVKKNVKSFTDGLDLLKKVNPVHYQYNGKGNTPKDVAFVGVIAQEVQSVFPYMISEYCAKLNEKDKEETTLLNFDGSALTYVIINAIKELDKKVEALAKKVNAKK